MSVLARLFSLKNRLSLSLSLFSFRKKLRTTYCLASVTTFVRIITLSSLLLLSPLSTHAITPIITKMGVTNTNIVPNGLVGYWTFDGKNMTNATATDVSSSGNNGTLTNMTASSSVSAGKIGQALTFDNVDDKVNMGTPSALNITGTLTISAWIYPRSFGGSSRGRIVDKIAGSGTGYAFLLDNSNTTNGITFGVNSGGGADIFIVGNVITLNKWQYVTVTLDAANVVSIYVNGIVIGTSTRNFPTSGANNFVIGGRTIDDGRTFDGKIDDVRIYNRALSTKEVLSLYKAGGGALAATAPTTNQNGTGIASGLVGYWTFDGKNMTNATATDISGNGNNGTLTGMTASSSASAGKIGQALTFDAVNDKINIEKPSSLNLTGALTVSAWIYPRSFGGSSIGRIVDKSNQTSNGYIFFVDNSNVSNGISFGVNSSLTASSELLKVGNSITLNKWQHVIVTLTSGRLATIYVNGVSVGTTTLANLPVSSSNENFIIGAKSSDDTRNFDGKIDDVRTYSRDLSANEVQSLYKTGQVATAVSPTVNTTSGGIGINSGLVGHWTFDGKNMTNATATDSSGQGNNGTLTNMTASSSASVGKLGQALTFDSIDDKVSASSTGVLNITSTLTISAWIYPRSYGVNSLGRIVDKNNGTVGYTLFTDNSNVSKGISFAINSTNTGTETLSVANSIVLNRWQHVIVTFNGNRLASIYINGMFVGSSTLNAFPTTSSAINFGIGSRTFDNLRNFDGKIDDVRIYNRPLSATEVKSLHKLGSQ